MSNTSPNHIAKLSFFLIKILHYSFLLAILKEHLSNPVFVISIFTAIVLLVTSYSRIYNNSFKVTIQDFIALPLCLLGAFLTYYLTTVTSLNVILSACIVGSIAALIPANGKLKDVSALLYCGVFVGMTASFVALGYSFILIASLIASLLFIGAKNQFGGFGGKLGTVAFGGVVMTSFIFYVIHNL